MISENLAKVGATRKRHVSITLLCFNTRINIFQCKYITTHQEIFLSYENEIIKLITCYKINLQ